jgi:hypothetical protein
VPQEGGLGQDLDVDARRRRLESDRLQLVAAVQPARRVHIPDRDREDEPPGQPRQPVEWAPPAADWSPPDDVVAAINRLQERFEMGRRPGRTRGRHEDEGMDGRLQLPPERLGQRLAGRVDDPDVHRAIGPGPEELGEARRHGLGLVAPSRPFREDEGVDSGVGDRVSAKVSLERIVVVARFGDAVAHRVGPPGAAASHSETAAR